MYIGKLTREAWIYKYHIKYLVKYLVPHVQYHYFE